MAYHGSRAERERVVRLESRVARAERRPVVVRVRIRVRAVILYSEEASQIVKKGLIRDDTNNALK